MDEFEALLARPVRLEPSAEPAPVGSFNEVDATTLGKLVELEARMRLPPALGVKMALRALEVQLGRRGGRK